MRCGTLILLLFLACAAVPGHAQSSELLARNLTQADGLPSNETYYAFQDSRQYLWLATDQGVVRYNGKQMQHFDLPDNVIFRILEDSRGRIWFFSLTGRLAYFENERIYPYEHNDRIAAQIKTISTIDAYVDRQESVWLSSQYGINYRIDRNGTIRQFDYRNEREKDTNTVLISAAGNGRLFTWKKRFVVNGRVSSLCLQVADGGSTTRYFVEAQLGVSIHCGAVRNAAGEIYFFTGNALIKLRRNGSYIRKMLPCEVLCVFIDKGGDILAGTAKQGVVRFSPDLEETGAGGFLSGKSVSCIASDNEGGSWYTTLEQGVYYVKDGRITHLGGFDQASQAVSRMVSLKDSLVLFANKNGIYSMQHDRVSLLLQKRNRQLSDLQVRDGTLFLAGAELENNPAPGIVLNTPGRYFQKVVLLNSNSEMAFMPDKTIVVNTGEIIARYRIARPIRHVQAFVFKPAKVYRDSANRTWLGTLQGLYTLADGGEAIRPFNEGSALFKRGISCIRQLGQGYYALGIRFGGIALMNDTGVVALITTKEGLLSNAVTCLTVIGNQLWAATAKGISVIRIHSYAPLRYSISPIGENKGFFNFIINQLLPFEGRIYAATSNGLYAIDRPEELLREPPRPIPLYISTITSYRGDTCNIRRLRLPYNRSRIAIQVSAVCFNAPEEVRYYYRMSNSGPSWHPIAGTELLLEKLSPGEYLLEVKASIQGQQRFSDLRQLEIVVEKPWWQNNWLRAAAAVAAIAALLLLYRGRIRKIQLAAQQKTALHQKMAELKQASLRAQMNPHFIFNCLSSIQQLILAGDMAEANDYLVRFSRLIRTTLELSASSFISIATEKDYLTEYLLLEQLRLPGQFDFEFRIDPSIDPRATEIPAMLLQPLVENSIRHGVKHLEHRKGRIRIVLQQEGRFIRCTVADNGIGREASGGAPLTEHKSYGLNLVYQRLENIAGLEGAADVLMEINDIRNGDGIAGTEVTIKLPYRTKSA